MRRVCCYKPLCAGSELERRRFVVYRAPGEPATKRHFGAACYRNGLLILQRKDVCGKAWLEMNAGNELHSGESPSPGPGAFKRK